VRVAISSGIGALCSGAAPGLAYRSRAMKPITPDRAPGPGSVAEVFGAFLRLGCTSFGGPVAHLGYFRTEFVERRRWLDDNAYADLVALCQFLPGPASSQVGFALGLQHAGWGGALAAWLGFTMPSALLLIGLALGLAQGVAAAGPAAAGALHGLKLVAVAVVAQALWGMARSLCPDAPRAALATGAALLAWAVPGGLIGHGLLKPLPLVPRAHAPSGAGRRSGAVLLVLAAALLLLLPALATGTRSGWLQAVAVVYQAGALVFGGGHVVLPLLQAAVVPPGWISPEAFMAGYGATQAVPGPLFTFAAYLGAAMQWPGAGGAGGVAGGLVMLVAVFLPGLLLVAGALPFWETLRLRAGVQRAMAGINAAVVGLLAAALAGPVGGAALHTLADLALAALALVLLMRWRWPPPVLVLLAAVLGAGVGSGLAMA
jgi:chromate transporter